MFTIPNWADFHQDLLERVSDCCIISDVCISPDYIRMQSVCKSWRSILKKKIMQRELPWLMILPNKEEEERDPDARVFFSLSKQKIHTIPLPEMRGKCCCGSFKNGWLMTVDLKLDICLFHPWSEKKIHLPHQSTFKKPYFVNDEGDEEGAFTYSMEQIRDREILKAALSDDGNMVVVVYGLGNLGFCRIGGDDSYTDIESLPYMEDVIYHKGQFYALSHLASVYLLHIEDGFHPYGEQLTINLDLDDPLPYTTTGYLVPDIVTDTMFVITRDADLDGHGHKTIRFDIFGVSLEEGAHDGTLKEFTKMESLGDRVIFLGGNSPMIIMASEFTRLEGNCIYFTDNIGDNYCLTPYGCRDLGVFNVEDGTVEVIFADRFHPIFSPPLWIATPPYSLQRDFGGEKLWLEEPHDV